MVARKHLAIERDGLTIVDTPPGVWPLLPGHGLPLIRAARQAADA